MTPWSDTINLEKNVDLISELGKDTTSKGSFTEDYEAFSLAADIVPCNRFDCLQEGAVVRLANTTIDIASWRCMLLAIAMAGSPIKELSIHACELSVDHIADLVTTLEKVGSLDVLKLDFLKLRLSAEQEGADAGRSLLSVLSSEKFAIKYLSLRGSLGDDFVSSEGFYTALAENVALQSLNLAANALSDASVSTICRALRVNAAIAEVSLAQNACTGAFLPDLASLLTGIEATPEEDAAWKNVAKLVGDKNKAVKDANKSRKKKGYPDLEEVSAPAERLVKVDDTSYIANRTLRALDLSFCPIDVSSFEAFMLQLQVEPKMPPEPALGLSLLLRGRGGDLIMPIKREAAIEGGEAAEAVEGEAEERVADAPACIPGLTIVY